MNKTGRWSKLHDKCVICSKKDSEHKSKGICSRCYQKIKKYSEGICSVCGNSRVLQYKDSIGNPICRSCYKKPIRLCSICQKYDKAGKKINKNEYVCTSCYRKLFKPLRLCDSCGKVGETKKIIDGKFLCQACYNKYFRPKKECSVCGKEKHVHKKDGDKSYCCSCYMKYFRPTHICDICGRKGIIEKNDNGIKICTKCYSEKYTPKRQCSICLEIKKIHKRVNGQDICKNCYEKKYRPMAICVECGRWDIIIKKIDGNPICPRCYNKYFAPMRICVKCNTFGKISKIIAEGGICDTCYRKYYKPLKRCLVCGQTKSTHKLVNDESVCSACYQRYYQPKRICSVCQNSNRIAAYIDGKSICKSCYNKFEGTCTRCGNVTKSLFRIENLCDNCWYTDKINKFLEVQKHSFTDTSVYNLFENYCKTLIKYRNPLRVFNIIIRQFEIFKYISIHKIDLKSFSLGHLNKITDELQCGEISSLINFFIKESIIKPTDPLESFYNLRNFYISKLNPNFIKIFINYTDYLVEKRNNLEYKGWYNRFTWKTCSTYAYLAYFFLDYISKSVLCISEITDIVVQEYYSSNSQYMVTSLRPFIKWLNKNIHFFKKLPLPKVFRGNIGGRPYSEVELLNIINSLSEPEVPYKDKLMGLLLVLYGVRPFELCQLKISNFKIVNEKTFLEIRNTRIIIHPFIYDLYSKYVKYEYNPKLSLGNSIDWLFCGRNYNTAMSINRVCEILRSYNINSIRAFSTAITNLLLTEFITPAVAIHGLGISISTIANYYKAVNISNTYNSDTFEVCNYNKIQKKERVNHDIFFVYILKCIDGSYYTGYTSDINKRLHQHKSGYGCTYTKTRTPVELVYSEELPDKPSALKREKQIKKLDTYKKEQLIEKSRIE